MSVTRSFHPIRSTLRLGAALAGAVVVGGFAGSVLAAGPTDVPKRSEDLTSIERDAFVIDFKPSRSKVGEAASVVVTVKAKGGFHLNQDYPHKLKLDVVPEGVKVDKSEFQRGDAQLEERSLTFKLAATPEKAGRYTVQATLKTSVCDEKQCILKTEHLALRVAGK